MGSITCWSSFLAAVLAVAMLGGCDSGADTADVEGVVTLDGQPLEGAEVEFQPVDDRPPSYGTTDEAGRYTLQFTADQSGALLGEHVVRISTESYSEDDSGNVTATEERVPAKYNADSELRAKVESGGNTHDFDLTSG